MEVQRKFLAVSILKCSPRSCAFLRFLFPLPSRRALHSLLNPVQFRMGVNAHVFSILKDNIQTMSEKDCMCCLMLDEVSITRSTVLEALSTMAAMAEQSIFHMKP